MRGRKGTHAPQTIDAQGMSRTEYVMDDVQQIYVDSPKG